MSGVALTLGFDNGPIRRHLAALMLLDARGFDGMRREIGEYFIGQVADNLHKQVLAPDGAPMPQSKASRSRTGSYVVSKTGREYYSKRKGAGKTLIDQGHLRNSYEYQLVDGGVEVGSALEYAAIHHFGGETGSKGHRFMMVARPVLGAGPTQEARLGDFLIAEITKTQRAR